MVKTPSCKCPHATRLYNIIGKKWVIFIMQAIDEGHHTFTTIRENIGEANTKILTDRLAELVTEGILIKSENGEYTLSVLGRDLSRKLIDLSHWWGEQNEKKN